MAQLDIFAFPSTRNAELHVRLQEFVAPTSITIKIDGGVVGSIAKGVTNKVYVVQLSNLEPSSTYSVEVVVTYGEDSTEIAEKAFDTKEEFELPRAQKNIFKDFYIAVGEPGAYSANIKYTDVFGLKSEYGIRIKHAPYSPMAKIKNVVVQSWKDEDGDDVWLPKATGISIGDYIPAVAHEAVEYNPVFLIYGNRDKMNSNANIRALVKRIEGKWLKVWDEYTHMGFEGVYLLDIDDDPKFKRRNYDHIEFTLKFKVNGTNIDAPFEGIV